MNNSRQQVLQLWLATGALDTNVTAWAFYDGTRGEGLPLPDRSPPYATGVEALEDGWHLIAVPGPVPVDSQTGELHQGFTFERRIAMS